VSDMKKAALAYAKLGWPVLPIYPIREGKCACKKGKGCHSPGKHPLTAPNGKKLATKGVASATTDPKKIEHFWSVYEDANIGVRCSEFFALDVDDLDALIDLQEEIGDLPDTVEQQTGGGGTHILFRHPETGPLGNCEGDLPHGINVRGEHGYILVAPSTHISGNEYTWEVSSHPLEVEVAEPPAALVKMIGADKSKGAEVVFEGKISHKVDIEEYAIHPSIKTLIKTVPNEGEDRSAMDQKAIVAMVDVGMSNLEIQSIFQTYAIGTHGKYADKGEHADRYLARSIARARAYLGNKSKVQSHTTPGKLITLQEAETERKILAEEYIRGYHDALAQQMDLLSMYPQYLPLKPSTVDLYSLGICTDYSCHTSDDTGVALVVPYQGKDGEIANIDYTVSVKGRPDHTREWQTNELPLFTTKLSEIDEDENDKLLIADDWDIALYLYLNYASYLPGYEIIALPDRSRFARSSGGSLRPLKQLVADRGEVALFWHPGRKAQAAWLAQQLRGKPVRWTSLPGGPRDMVRIYGLNGERFKRYVDYASEV